MNQASDFKFNRKLSVFDAWTLAFGGIIGYGAFIMPGTTFLKGAGILGTLIAMEIGAFMMLIISYAYGYMAKKFSMSGGQFVYAEKAFGKKHGFLCAWFLGLCYLCIIPMDATALSMFFRTLFGTAFQFGFHYVVSGYDVYFGEFLVAAAALILFAYVASRNVRLGAIIQNSMVIILIAGVFIILCGAIFSPEAKISNFQPLFYTDDRSPFLQVLSIVVAAPWAFVGFDIIPQISEEALFSNKKVKVIMDTSVVAGCFFYVVMTFFAASVIPEGFSDWVRYVDSLSLNQSDDFSNIMTFYAAYKILGMSGLYIICAAGVCGVLTGILAFYIATSRLLYSMAREKMLPSWFGVLNKNGVPFNAIIFCMVISILTSLLGRHALGWTVDMASLGGAIGFGYTSLASYKYSLTENRKDVAFLGAMGFVISVIFALLLLVPIPVLNNSLAKESYILLVIWLAIGGVFYFSLNRRETYASIRS